MKSISERVKEGGGDETKERISNFIEACFVNNKKKKSKACRDVVNKSEK